jgi:hypothetical protein
MKRWMVAATLAVLVSVGGNAHAIEGLTGSTWGTMLYNFGHDDLQTLGNFSQGIDWFEWRGSRFTTYAALRWRYQSNEGMTFNAWGPAVGAAIKRGPVRVGTEYYWEQLQVGTANNRGLVFVDWFHDWDLMTLFK